MKEDPGEGSHEAGQQPLVNGKGPRPGSSDDGEGGERAEGLDAAAEGKNGEEDGGGYNSNGLEEKKAKVEDEVVVDKLPAFRPLEKEDNGDEVVLRIPGVVRVPEHQQFSMDEVGARVSIAVAFPYSNGTFIFQIQNEASAEDILKGHMGHWQAVKRSWKTAYAKNEERYKDSLEVLKNMFER